MDRLAGIIWGFALEWGLLLLIATLYVLNLSSFDFLSIKELYYAEAAREMLQTGQWLIPMFNHESLPSFPPLYLWLVEIFYRLFGVELWAARLVTVLSSLLGLVFLYALAGQLFSHRFAAFLSVLVMATSWGYFKYSQVATSDVLFIALMIATLWGFHHWLSVAMKRKPQPWEYQPISLFLGLVLGLLFLLKGLLGVLLPVLVIFGFLFFTGALRALVWIDWKRFVLAFLLILLPWLVLVSLQEKDPAFLIQYMFNFSNLPDILQRGESTLFGKLGFYLQAMLLELFPYNLFLLVLLVDPDQRLRDLPGHAYLLLMLWFGLTFLASLVFLTPQDSTVVLLLPPLVLLVGFYLSRLASGDWLPRFHQLGLESTIVLVLGISILITIFLFQVLPDLYPVSFWKMPGPALIDKIWLIKEIPLENPIPIWKFWLLPVSLALLLGGFMMSVLLVLHRQQTLGMLLIGTSFVFLLCVKLLYLPVMHRPVAEDFARVINEKVTVWNQFLAGTPNYKELIVLDARQPGTLNTMFFLKRSLSMQVSLVSRPEDLKNVLVAGQYSHVLAVLPERYYYEMDYAVRRQFRVLSHNWHWNAFELEAIGGILAVPPRHFNEMTYRMLLLEWTPLAQDDSSGAAEDSDALL